MYRGFLTFLHLAALTTIGFGTVGCITPAFLTNGTTVSEDPSDDPSPTPSVTPSPSPSPFAPVAFQFGNSSNERPAGLYVSSAGKVYVSGTSTGNLLGATSIGSTDIFYSRFDAETGASELAGILGSTAADDGYGIWVNETDSTFRVTRHVAAALNGQAITGTSDLFVRKFATDGSVAWTYLSGHGGDDQSWAITGDTSGNTYVTGSSTTSTVGVVVAAVSDSGSALWSPITIPGGGFQRGYGIVKLGSELWIAGEATAGLNGETAIGGSNDAFVAKVNASTGAVIDVALLGTASANDRGLGLAKAPDESFVCVSGTTAASFDPDFTYAGTGNDFYVARVNPDLTTAWVRQLGTTATDGGSYVLCGVDSENSVYVAGMANGSIHGEPALGDEDVVLAKYTSAGTLVWTKQIGTSAKDSIVKLFIDAHDRIYLSIRTYGALAGTQAGSGTTYDVAIVPLDSDGNQLP